MPVPPDFAALSAERCRAGLRVGHADLAEAGGSAGESWRRLRRL